MVSSAGSVSNVEPYGGDTSVQFGNGNTLHISSIGSSKIANGIHLRDVLVVPCLNKNLLSISKLTRDNPVDVLFSASSFFIQDQTTKQVLTQGKCDRRLYVLATSPKAYAFFAGSKPRASFELWHSRLGHVSFDTISMLNKLGLFICSSVLGVFGFGNTLETYKRCWVCLGWWGFAFFSICVVLTGQRRRYLVDWADE